MDVIRERQTILAQRIFGADARIAGCVGSAKHPGVLTIMVGKQALGSGVTLEQAIGEAIRRSRQTAAPTSCDCLIRCHECRCGVA